MPGPRRMAPSPVPPSSAAPAAEAVNFGSLNFYAGGFTLPKGQYALEFNVVMRQSTNMAGQKTGKPRLGVAVSAYPLSGGDVQEQFLSMGTNADQSFAPDPTTGKGLIAVPGGPAITAPRNTNWNVFLKSLYDSGLPGDAFTTDLRTIDGIWVQTDLVPEPEERKGYGSAQTGEAAQEQRQGSGLIPVVVQILDGGKPWEGTGGFPQPAPAATPPVARQAPIHPTTAVARPIAGRVVAPPAPVAVAAPADDDLMTAAINGVTEVLTDAKNVNGCSKLLLRTGTFKNVSAAAGGEMAQAVIENFFGSDETLNSVLGQLGYTVVGVGVKPVV